MKKWHCFPVLVGMLFCMVTLFGETDRAFAAENFYVVAASSSSTDITQLKAAVKALQSQVAALQGRIFPYDLVNMYEDSTVKIELTGESKTITDPVSHYTKIRFRLLITNKTSSPIYIGQEDDSQSVYDENGNGEVHTRLSGIEWVYGNTSNVYSFSAIGPKTTLTAGWANYYDNSTKFYDSHYLTASFGFVLYGSSSNTRFNAGFTGIYLP